MENFYVPFKKVPVFAKTVAFVWHFSQKARQAAFLELPIWPKQVVSGFLLWWFEMGRINAARSWLLTKTEG